MIDEEEKNAYMNERAVTDQLLADSASRPAIDPEVLAKLQQMAAAEQERNQIREMGNIGADLAEGGTRSSRLSLDDAAKNRLQGMLAKSQGISDKDRLGIQKGRERMAGFSDLNKDKQGSIDTRFDKRQSFNKDKFRWKQGEEGEKKLTAELNTFRSAIKPITAQLDAVKSARSLLEADNPIADKALLRKMARLSGEVGAMTDKDVTDFESSKAIADRVEQIIATAVDGKLTKTNRDYINKVVDFIERSALENKKARATEYAGQRGYGSQDSQKIYDTLMVTDKWKPKQHKEAVTKQAPASDPKGNTTAQEGNPPEADPKIQEYADKYYNGDYSKAEQLLRSRGYGK